MSRSFLVRAVLVTCLVTSGVGCGGSESVWAPPDADAPESNVLPARHYVLETVLDLSPMLDDDGGLASWLVDLGDGPFDPATWLLDWANQAAPTSGPLATAWEYLALHRQFVDPMLYGVLVGVKPDLVSELRRIAGEVSLSAREFRWESRLDLGAGRHSGAGLDGSGLVALQRGTRLELGTHTVIFSVPAALEKLLVETEPFGESSGPDAVLAWLDCSAVGQVLSERIPVGSTNLWTQACHVMRDAAWGVIRGTFEEDGEPFFLELTGDALLADKNGDGLAESLESGRWRAVLRRGEREVPLGQAVFHGRAL